MDPFYTVYTLLKHSLFLQVSFLTMPHRKAFVLIRCEGAVTLNAVIRSKISSQSENYSSRHIISVPVFPPYLSSTQLYAVAK